MGAFTLLTIGSRAMAANYSALQTTGHNIANASVEGYSRQRAELTTAQPQFTGAGYLGRGVDVQTVSRSHDQFLTREAATTSAASRMDEARLEALRKLEEVFRPGELGLGHAAGQFMNSMVDLASRPADDSTRQVVLARAADVAQRFSGAARQLDTLQSDISASVSAGVERINGLSRSIAATNVKVVAAQGLGQPPNDLLDERDRLVGELSELLQVSTLESADGALSVFIGGGQPLVLGAQAAQLKVLADESDPNRVALAISDAQAFRRLDSEFIGGGSIGGWLRFQNEDLVQARTSVGQMASALAGVVNQQQAFGLDLRQPAGAGAPLFGLGQPVVQPAASNEKLASGAFVAEVSLTITDPTQLKASEYALSEDATGAWQLVRLSDGVARSVADGDEVDGFTVSLGSPPPAVGDRFLLQPVTYVAGAMTRAMADPRGLAAAAPFTAEANATNQGTATVASLEVVDATFDASLDATITFNSGTGGYDYALTDRTTGASVATGSGTWTPGQAIEVNGTALRLSGVPASGDVFSLVGTRHPRQNNSNALALVALGDIAFVGRTLEADGSYSGGSSVTDAYASAMADVGVRVQVAASASQISTSVAQQAEQRRAAGAGVNLDEEAARLLQYQQSYQAAAKVLQIAQSVFDTLIQIGG